MLNLSPIDHSLRALAEPTRRAMIERLGRGPAAVSDLAKPFDMSLAAVVQHVQVLEECGLVRTEKIGRVRTCSLDPAGMKTVADWVAARRQEMERRFDRLGEILAEQAAAEELKPSRPKLAKPRTNRLNNRR